MTQVQGYDPNSQWLNQVNHDNIIDYFFTQRKVVEYEEIIDEKTLDRKSKKINKTVNFLAINLPNNQFQNVSKLTIDIEIWGDQKYNYKGSLCNKDGDFPHLLLKLNDDKQLFLKLIYNDNEQNKILKTFTVFIPILKRYQITPNE